MTYQAGDEAPWDLDDLLANRGARVRPPGCEGIQIMPGERFQAQVTLGGSSTTFELAMELMARDAKSVSDLSIIMGQSVAAASPGDPGAFVNAGFVSAFADLDGVVALTQVNFQGPGSAARLQRSVSTVRREFQFSDPLLLAPPARSDGGTRPIAVARGYYGIGNTAIMGGPAGSPPNFDAWATRAAGKSRIRVNSGAGDQRTATANWGLTSQSPLVGFAFGHAGPVFNVMSAGDSLFVGQDTYRGAGPALLACEAINNGTPKSWMVHSNIAWSGAASTTIVQNIRETFEQGIIPDILYFPTGTPNDVTPGNPITDTIVNNWRAYTIAILRMCASYGVLPMGCDVRPVNYAVQQWGASDSTHRKAYNTEMAARFAAMGLPYVAASSVLSGGVDGNGQETMLFNLDNIHFTEAGKAAEGALVKDQLEIACKGYL